MRTLAHGIRIRTNACVPLREEERAYGDNARSRTLCARKEPRRCTPSGNAPPALRPGGCVPLRLGAADLSREEGEDPSLQEVSVAPPTPGHLQNSLRLLARWLVAASWKGVPGGADSPRAEPHNPLDVVADPKVMSETE